MHSEPRIRRADPTTRARAFAALGALGLVGLATILLVRARIDAAIELARTDPGGAAADVRTAATLVFASVALGTLALSFVLLRTSIAALRCGEFPPPSAIVLVDTPILEGRAAHRRAIAAIVVATIVAGLGVGIPLAARSLLDTHLYLTLQR